MRRVPWLALAACLSCPLLAGDRPTPRKPAARRKPLAVPLCETTRRALSDSDAGLVETPLPGGGVLVDLQGRYQTAVVAVVDADGTVRIGCVSHLPEESPKR